MKLRQCKQCKRYSYLTEGLCPKCLKAKGEANFNKWKEDSSKELEIKAAQ